MKINVQSIHFDADSKLLEFIQKKADKLDHYFDQIISGNFYLKLDNPEKEANKICEVKLGIPGHDLFCKEHGKTFEAATDMAIECIKLQINRHKERLKEHNSNHKHIPETDEFL